ncbi:spore coat protein GerQ [Paenibacillus sp. JX-17]|uniref:Spore coat protein GerQ n=1 Tax=Paenibacillus lacisoli TaxID=3064525 RepID=A0ABT9C6H5_9BACL|nr:spore coat protein GerQ [Paenibacillus sp. JX-17]MDO7904863.1 spore coat protein GerQ [Paenibacillus sp. JX-17]
MLTQPYRTVSFPGTSVPSGSGMMQGSMTQAPVSNMMPPTQVQSGGVMSPTGTVINTSPPVFEQSYIENILRLNLGKIGTFYMTYENNSQWNAKIFKGVLEAAGRDHIIISDPSTGVRTILLMVNLDYATFDQPLTYQYPGVVGNPPTRR